MAFERLRGKQGLGAGDVKLFFVGGLFLGAPLGLFAIIVACIVGLVFAVLWTGAAPDLDDEELREREAGHEAGSGRHRAGRHASQAERASQAQSMHKAFPFGPAIAIAIGISLLVGPNFLNWYLSLFF